MWVGGSVTLVFVGVPVVRRLPPAQRAQALRALGRRWRPLGWGALAVLVASGLVLAYRSQAADPGVLFGSRFGRILIAKSVLVVALVALAAAHDFLLGPRLARQIERGDPQSARRPLVLVGWASLAATIAIPVLGVLLTR